MSLRSTRRRKATRTSTKAPPRSSSSIHMDRLGKPPPERRRENPLKGGEHTLRGFHEVQNTVADFDLAALSGRTCLRPGLLERGRKQQEGSFRFLSLGSRTEEP